MKLATAFKIVLDLAEQSVVDAEDMPEEYDRQQEAIAEVEKHALEITTDA